ncbi:hypothetical protein KM043_000920 [Ampulex compressa]|nr:hypothetical protein KM043_000920 [Ampulex compressa]
MPWKRVWCNYREAAILGPGTNDRATTPSLTPGDRDGISNCLGKDVDCAQCPAQGLAREIFFATPSLRAPSQRHRPSVSADGGASRRTKGWAYRGGETVRPAEEERAAAGRWTLAGLTHAPGHAGTASERRSGKDRSAEFRQTCRTQPKIYARRLRRI